MSRIDQLLGLGQSARFRHDARLVGAISAAILALALPLVGQKRVAFEFFVVSGSNNDVPPLLAGTTDLEDSLNIQICDELAEGHPAGDIASQLQLTAAELQSHIDALLRAQLLLPGSTGSYTPTFPIVHRADAAWFTGIDKPLIDATVRAIEARQQELNTHFRNALHLDADQARTLSLVLFGDALFDRWQTKNVRKDFLPGYPPPRDGKLFFVAGLEKVPGSIASLGVYTHAESRYGDVTVVTYGRASVIDPFADEKPESVPHLIESYLAFVNGSSPATPGLQRLGFVRGGKPDVVVIPQSAYAALPEITNSFTDELLRLLNADRPKIVAAHEASRYARTVSFQEFALWWYHFFDAAVVGQLIKHGVITVPPAGYATMIVVPK
jgi:hypothetical protein